MRKYITFLCALCCAAMLSARGGVLAGSKGKLHVLRTTYFDVIYPEEAADAGKKIAAVADGYYEKICERLQTTPYQRFPVTITNSVEDLNAYFTILPYNRIVLYNTPPDTNLDMNSQTLEAVFFHELTHAVSINIKSPAIRFVSGMFGDMIAPSMFMLPTFFLEGVTVSFESMEGEGRLNDPFSLQPVLQAKLSDQFPSWRDVLGARDIFPRGTAAYMFGGAFSRYLITTYGLEKYGEFWLASGSLSALTINQFMKKVYGISMDDAWHGFEDWLTVPAATAALEAESGSADFFASQNISALSRRTGFSKLNSKRGVYSLLDRSDFGVAWYESKSGAVWYAGTARGDGSFALSKPKKLFTCYGASRLALSGDGRYLALSYVRKKRTEKRAVCLYDLARKKLIALPLESVREAGFAESADGEPLLVAVDVSSTPSRLLVYRLGSRKRDVALVNTIALYPEELAYTPVGAGKGKLACIVKHGMDWAVRVYDASSACAGEGAAPLHDFCISADNARVIVHNLHSYASGAENGSREQIFTFSYATQGATVTASKAEPSASEFPRAGFLHLHTDGSATLCLQSDDIAGGVLDAVYEPRLSGKSILYISGFYDTQRLLQLDTQKRLMRTTELSSATAAPADDALAAAGTNAGAAEASDAENAAVGATAAVGANAAPADGASLETGASYEELGYNPFRYAVRGTRLLVGSVPIYRHDDLSSSGYTYLDAAELNSVSAALLGATFATANPWGDHVLQVSGGWSPYYFCGGASAAFSGGDDSFSYAINGSLLYDGNGFMQTAEGLQVKKVLYNHFISSFVVGASGMYFYGHDGTDKFTAWLDRVFPTDDDEEATDSTDGSTADDESTEDDDAWLENDWAGKALCYAQFSTVHKVAPAYGQYAGFSVKPFLFAEKTDFKVINAGATMQIRVPGLIPLSLSATLFPSSTSAASGSVGAILFVHEIQKAIPIAVYVNRLVFSAGYSADLAYEGDYWFDIRRTSQIFRDATIDDYTDAIWLKSVFIVGGNYGELANPSTQFEVGFMMQYSPHPEADKKKLSGSMVFSIVL